MFCVQEEVDFINQKDVKKSVEGFTRQIGTTVYQVNVIFDENAVDSFEDKLLHLLKNDLFLGETSNNDN